MTHKTPNHAACLMFALALGCGGRAERSTGSGAQSAGGADNGSGGAGTQAAGSDANGPGENGGQSAAGGIGVASGGGGSNSVGGPGGGGYGGVAGHAGGGSGGAMQQGGGDTAGTGGATCGGLLCAPVPNPCPAGQHAGKGVGECCPSCIADSNAACTQGQAEYRAFRQALLQSNDSCTKDADCIIYIEHNRCTNGCGVAISGVTSLTFASALTMSSLSNCSTCPAQPQPPCAAFRAVCQAGVCTTR